MQERVADPIYLLVDGVAATFSDGDGKMMGQRMLTKPLGEGDEYSFGGKDFLVVDSIAVSEYFSSISPSPVGQSLGTPAKTGWFARPGQKPLQTPQPPSRAMSATSASTSKPAPASTSEPLPGGARNNSPAPDVHHTPASASKNWLHAKDKMQKPFKPLVPQRLAAQRTPSVEPFSGLPVRRTSTNGGGTPGPSRLSKEVGGREQPGPLPASAARAKSKGKGKEREREPLEEEGDHHGEDVENTPPSSQTKGDDYPAPPSSKKRRLDPFAADTAPAPPRRPSAADAAFAKAASRTNTSSSSFSSSTGARSKPPSRPSSAAGTSRLKPWDDPPQPRPSPCSLAGSTTTLFRQPSPAPLAPSPPALSPVKTAVKPEPTDEEMHQHTDDLKAGVAVGGDVVMRAVKPEPDTAEGDDHAFGMDLEMDAAMFAGVDDLEAELAGGGTATAGGQAGEGAREADDSGCFVGMEGVGEDRQEEEDEQIAWVGKKALIKDKGKGKAVVPDEDGDAVEEREAVMVPSQVQEGGEKKRYFSCQWRKRSSRKNPSFEGDGVLVVNGEKAELKDADTGERISTGRIARNALLDDGDELDIGGMTLAIERSIGKPICSSASASVLPGKKPSAPPPNGAYKAFRPPSAAKATQNPLARSSAGIAAAARSTSPEASRPPSSSAVRAGSVSSTSFFLPGAAAVASKFRPLADGGKGSAQGKKAAPRFDPEREGAVVMRQPDEEHAKQYNQKGLTVVDVVIDPILGDKLRDHQKEGVRFMYECVMGMRTAGQGCILADDMGLGKTIQSIALIWTMLKQTPYYGDNLGSIQRAMIVCPVTLVKNWSSEIKKWLGKDRLRVKVADSKQDVGTFARSKSYDVLIIGYEKLRSCIDEVKFAQPPIGLIICDEGHRLKSSGAKTTQALQSLSCMRRVILSGTPIQNNLGEFFAMMDFVNPGLFKDYQYFKKHFEQPITKSRQPNASKKDKEAGQEASALLSEIQRNFVLRRTNEVNQQHLPPKHDFSVFILPTLLEINLYRQVLSGSTVTALLEGDSKKDQLSLLTSLRKLSNSPGLIMQGAQTDKGCEALGEELVDLLPQNVDPSDFALSAKLSVLGTLLAELRSTSEEKVVVISNFTKTLDIVEKHCRRKKYPFCRLDGQTPQQERIPMVTSFNRGTQKNSFIFLLSSKSGGTGLNIIGASRLVMLDADWNPSTDAQAMARIHREGQARTCYIYRFFTVGTLDEKVFQRQITKLALAGSIMGEDSAAGETGKGKDSSNKGSSGGSNTFSPEELRAIFTLHDESACETHDLLGCRCHFGEGMPSEDDEEGDEAEESDEDEAGGGFQQASQWQGETSRQAAKQRRNLSILRTYSHYNCSDDTVIDTIDDQLLRSVIYERVAVAAEGDHEVPPQGRGELPLRGGQVGWVFGKRSG
ncbi:hypothetical protein JCM11251_001575 [Rhodosporidiobolus azoricus]